MFFFGEFREGFSLADGRVFGEGGKFSDFDFHFLFLKFKFVALLYNLYHIGNAVSPVFVLDVFLVNVVVPREFAFVGCD